MSIKYDQLSTWPCLLYGHIKQRKTQKEYTAHRPLKKKKTNSKYFSFKDKVSLKVSKNQNQKCNLALKYIKKKWIIDNKN